VKFCRVCDWRRSWCKGLCQACYFYQRRTGRERPDELIVKHAKRVLASRQAGERISA